MIDYKDEILEAEPKYRIRDKNGNIIFDELTIEQITPTLQAGTEQNQYLFSNIKANVYLNGLFNQCKNIEIRDDSQIFNFDFNLDKYERGLILNLDTTPLEHQAFDFTSRIFPYFTANGTIDGFTVSDSSSAWKCFDGDKSTHGSCFSGSIYITCPIFINPKAIYFYGYEDVSNDGTLNIYGITNDGTEVLLNTTTWSGTTEQLINIDTTEYYKAFRFKSSPNYSSTSSDLRELSIEIGKKSQIRTDLPFYININNLGEKLIVGIIDLNRKYELVYDGTVFNAKEVE